jgi:hypothetical protein
MVSAGPSAAAVAGDSVAIVGGTRLTVGLVIVNCTDDETPNELEAVTPAVPAKAVSVGKIDAVS